MISASQRFFKMFHENKKQKNHPFEYILIWDHLFDKISYFETNLVIFLVSIIHSKLNVEKIINVS